MLFAGHIAFDHLSFFHDLEIWTRSLEEIGPSILRIDGMPARAPVAMQTLRKSGEQRMSKLRVNGKSLEVDAEEDTPLLWVLREQLGLTGTKYGCGIAACGACTVHIDGVAVRSCTVTLADVSETEEITTIEGLSDDLSHPIQQAWLQVDVPQCGYCQSGQIMAAAAFLAENPKPTDDDIREGISNLCRCGTYNRIKAGIKLASELI